ncbi:MAG: hypothetical protein JSW52_01200 [Candidatus Coatesbacteria bacterium]|nr:MAG: hypothetical protein JSW52_07695 [Candidatus Coatesbacteria bacterium]UCE27398.1 MAG: hypothetical protein JSW52_01200 [Candidatus Coatesbacteria bacterium]
MKEIVYSALVAVLSIPSFVTAGEEVSEPPEDISIDFDWDGDDFFLDMEAGDSRVKFDSVTGEYEVYIPKNPDSEEPYFRENDLYVSIDEVADRVVVIAKGNKDTIRESLDDIFEGDPSGLEEGENDGVIIRELDDGYEIIIEDKAGPDNEGGGDDD